MKRAQNQILVATIEKSFRVLLWLSAIIIVLLVAYIVGSLLNNSIPTFKEFGVFRFIFSTDWNPTEGRESYGAMVFIAGTVLSSAIALLIAIPFSIPVALFVGEYFKGTKLASFFSALIDMLAGVPSVVFGLLGYYAVRPLFGFSLITSSIVLAIMIIPYATSLSSEFISMVPRDLKEAAYALGATRFEMIRKVLFSSAGSGVFASYILALGRALGETMAVTMLIGNLNKIPTGLLSGANSMASLIANQFGEAVDLKMSSLFAIALLLFLITAIFNGLGRIVMRRFKS